MADKFPPNTFTYPPARWEFKAGGSVAHIPGSRSIACERCHETSGAGMAGPSEIAAVAAFLHQHAGPVCGSTKGSR